MGLFDDVLGSQQSGSSGLFDDVLKAPEKPKSPGAFRSLSDSALSFARGGAGAAKAMTDVFGAGNEVSNAIGKVGEGIDSLESDYSRQKRQEGAQRMQTAAKSGSTLEELKAAGQNFMDRPVDFALEGAGSIIPTAAVAALTRNPAALAGVAAAQGAGEVKGQIYDTVKQKGIEAGLTPEETAKRAEASQAYTGDNAGQIALGAGLGVLAGSTGVERALSGSIGKGGLARRVLTQGAAEAIPEAAQGGQQALASNLALQREGYDVPTMQGVVGQAALEGLASAPVGAASGIRGPKPKTNAQGQEPPTAETPTEQPVAEPVSLAISNPETLGTLNELTGKPVTPYEAPYQYDAEAEAFKTEQAQSPFVRALMRQKEIAKVASTGPIGQAAATGMQDGAIPTPSEAIAFEHQAREQAVQAITGRDFQGYTQSVEQQNQNDINALEREGAFESTWDSMQPEQREAVALESGVKPLVARVQSRLEWKRVAENVKPFIINQQENANGLQEQGQEAAQAVTQQQPAISTETPVGQPAATTETTPATSLQESANLPVTQTSVPATLQPESSAPGAVTSRQSSPVEAVAPMRSVETAPSTNYVDGMPFAEDSQKQIKPDLPRKGEDIVYQYPRINKTMTMPEAEALHARYLDIARQAREEQKNAKTDFLRGMAKKSNSEALSYAKQLRQDINTVKASFPTETETTGVPKAEPARQTVPDVPSANPARAPDPMPDGVAASAVRGIGAADAQATIRPDLPAAGKTPKVGAQPMAEGAPGVSGAAEVSGAAVPIGKEVARYSTIVPGAKGGRGVVKSPETKKRIAQLNQNNEGIVYGYEARDDGRFDIVGHRQAATTAQGGTDSAINTKVAQPSVSEVVVDEQSATGKAEAVSGVPVRPSVEVAAPSKQPKKARKAEVKPEGGNQPDKVVTEGGKQYPEESALIDMQLLRDRGDVWQYKFDIGGSWKTANTKEDAIQRATEAYEKAPESERLTGQQRADKADAELYAEMDSRYGRMSDSELADKYAELGWSIADLQKAGEREFNGNGGRRTSSAVSNEGARSTGEEKLRLGVYIKMRQENGAKTQHTPPLNNELTTGGKKEGEQGRIEDFGEKLGGARKDLSAAIKQEYSDSDIASLPLSKIWPADLAEKIDDKLVAAFAFAARQEIPAKPRVKYKVDSWVKKVKMLRDLAGMMTDSATTRVTAEALLKQTKALEGFNAKVSLLESIDREQWKRIGKVWEHPNAYNYDQDGKKVPAPSVMVEIDDRREFFEGAKSAGEVIDQVNEKLGVAAKGKRMEFEVRGQPGAYFINKKGDPLYRKLKTFTDSKEAMAFKYDNYGELVAAWDAVKDSDNVKESDLRTRENRERTAEDWRKGKDVTPEQFISEFGFRGVEFGLWVKQGKNAKERQGMLNAAYDALMDLSSIINVPPKALSLEGTLGLGFGSRGSGAASAHFEPDMLVINLTKTRGAGTLAHEWFHALDNHFQLKRGKPSTWQREDGYITYNPENYYVHQRTGMRIPERDYNAAIDHTVAANQNGTDAEKRAARVRMMVGDPTQWVKKEGVRTEVGEAFADLVKALNDSPMAKRASLIDKGKSGGYWSRIIERGARSFENYVIHKMMLKGYHNDYLANVTPASEFMRDAGRYPYLLEGEIEPVAEAFDTLFQTIKTKETDKGVAMFSRAQSTKSTIHPEDFAAVVQNARAAFPGMQFNALEDEKQAPASLRSFIEDQDASGDVAGAYHDGEIYLFQNGIRDIAQAEHTVVHEAAHAGLSRMFGDSVGPVMLDIKRSNLKVAAKAFELQKKYGYSVSRATEEVLADMGPEVTKLKKWDALVAFVRDQLRKVGLVKEWSDKDVEALVLRALKAAKKPQSHVYRRSALNAMLSIGDSDAIVSGVGRDLVTLYHGTSVENADKIRSSGRINSGSYFGGINGVALTPRKSVADDFSNGGEVIQVRIPRSRLIVDPESYDGREIDEALADGASVYADGDIYIGGYKLDAMREADARFSRSGQSTGRTQADSIWSAEPISKMDTFLYELQDKHIDTKRIIQAIQKQGKKIADEWNVYIKESLYHGRTAKKTEDFLTDEVKPALELMAKHGISQEDMDEYLHARHAIERNRVMKERNPDREDNDGLSGMTDDDAKAILAKAKPGYEEAAKAIDAIIAKTRQELVAYGLEKQETVDSWASLYKHYVPLQREGFEDRPGTGMGFSVRGKSSKEATGSHRAVENVLAHVAMQREKAIVRGEKNRVATALYGLAQQFPNSAFWKLDKPAQMTQENPETGQVEVVPGDLADYKVPRVKYIGKDGTVKERIDPNYKGRNNVLTVRINGVDHAIIFNEQDQRAMRMVEALKNIDADQLGEIVGGIGKVTRYIASMATQYNPVFGVINIMRDSQTAMLNLSSTDLSGKQSDVFKASIGALQGIYKDARAIRRGQHPKSDYAKLWEEFQSIGGQTGYRDMFRTSKDRADAINHLLDPNWWQKTRAGKVVTLNGILSKPEQFMFDKFGRHVFNWLSDYNLAMENAFRLGAYKVAIENGMSKDKAAFLAKALTVNFNKKGRVATQAGALYAFFNASAQGTARIAETLNAGAKEGEYLGKVGKQIVYGGIMLGAMQSVALMLAGFGEDEPPEFIRERSIIIPAPGTEKGYIAYPMPLGFHVLPNIGRVAVETALYGDPMKRVTDLLMTVLEAFNPIGTGASIAQTISPTLFDPVIALSENKDWTGKAIYKEDFSSTNPTPGFSRTKDSASALSKGVAYGINWITGGTDYQPGRFSPTPDQLDYLIGQVTGGVGRELTKAMTTAGTIASGEDLPMYKVPLLGRLVGTAGDNAAIRDKFYDNVRMLNMHEAEIKGRRENGEPTLEYIRDNPESRLVKLASSVESDVRKLQKRKRQMIEDGKRESVKLIEVQIAAKMRRLNERVDEIQKN